MDDNDNKLLNLLEKEAEKISLGYKIARLEGKGTPQEVSDRREGVFASFLEKYFPFPYRIVKGNIIDSYGGNSASIDCVVLNPSHPYTVDKNNGKASVIFADGVDFAIEIKPDLKGKELERALKQIQSVKKLRRVRDGLILKHKYSENQLEAAKVIPCYIVAEDTYKDMRTLIEKITDFYVENKVPQIEQFNCILINNRSVVVNVVPDVYSNHRELEKTNSIRYIGYKEDGPKSLAWFLFEMSRAVKSEPELSLNIMSIYLKDTVPELLKTFYDLNAKLTEAGV